jgi:hypothetical protein
MGGRPIRDIGLVLLVTGIGILLYDIAIGLRVPGGQTLSFIYVVAGMIAIGAVLLLVGLVTRK